MMKENRERLTHLFSPDNVQVRLMLSALPRSSSRLLLSASTARIGSQRTVALLNSSKHLQQFLVPRYTHSSARTMAGIVEAIKVGHPTDTCLKVLRVANWCLYDYQNTVSENV